MLSHEEKLQLLLSARQAIDGALNRAPAVDPPPRLPGLMQRCGLFVTLKLAGQLRGCIGYIESQQPLYDTIGEIAVKSALEDPRFAPLTDEELSRCTIQLSILSPLRRIHGVEEITIGTHGLLLEVGPQRGLLLPQVAVEFQWEPKAFLEATARKAGLHRAAWQDRDAKIYVFTAEIIDESEMPDGRSRQSPPG